MPLTHTRKFRVRYDECDAYGHLNNVNYLRYAQETAFDAAAAAGYDMARLARIKRQWWVHETMIEYLQPVVYNEVVSVKTWISDFRRVSSRRRYEVERECDRQPVARAYTDWIYIDTETGRPVKIPAEVVDAFYPEGLPEAFPPREPFPEVPAPPPGVFETEVRVRWQDIDTARHVNNATYMDYISDCGMQVIAAHNWPVTRMAEEGFAIFIHSHRIQYHRPARYDDRLIVATWASDVRRATALRHYTIRRKSDNELLVRVNSLGAWVSLESGRPIRIPEKFLEDFRPNIVGG